MALGENVGISDDKRKPGRLFTVLLFLLTFTCIYTCFYYSELQPQRVYFSKKLSEDWKMRLRLPVFTERKAGELPAQPPFQILSLSQLDIDSKNGIKHTFLFPVKYKSRFSNYDVQDIRNSHFRRLRLLSETKSSQTWTISYTLLALNEAVFKYTVYTDRVVPISVIVIPRIKCLIFLTLSLFFAALSTWIFGFLMYPVLSDIKEKD